MHAPPGAAPQPAEVLEPRRVCRVITGMKRLLLLLLPALFLGACGLPKDPRNTLQTVQGGTLRAGLIEGQPNIEADRALLQHFADELQAELIIERGGAHALMHKLGNGELNIVASLPKNTPFKHAGYTHPVGPKPHEDAKPPVWAIRKGENAFLLRINQFLMPEGPEA